MKLPHAPESTPEVALPEKLKSFADAGLNQADIKALIWLDRLLEETGAGWATEAQWRSYADRPTIQPEFERARGFRLPGLLEKGVISMTTGVFHQPRNGTFGDPVSLYRLNL